jgi:ParB family chromosome partitioning protein
MKNKQAITVSGLVGTGQLPDKPDPTKLTQFKEQDDFSNERIYSVALDKISPNPYQPRKIFHKDKIIELADSIKAEGLIQPIALRIVNSGESYQIIAGERRFRAYQYLGKTEIECVVFICDDKQMLTRAIAENLGRQDLTDFEAYSSIVKAIPLFETKKDLAGSIGIGREDLYRYLSFDDLPDFVVGKLEINPGLLGKTAATEIKSALSKIEEKNKVLAHIYLAEALELLEAGDLDQNKIVQHVNLGIKRDAQAGLESLTRREEFIFDGNKIGYFTSSPNGVMIKVAKGILDEESKGKLQGIINGFLEQILIQKKNDTVE